ncbi:bifunctional 4-hydroxy-3-methylbut-2-enyl diphosphate reductase/30S ribosomal protein S1 [Pseudoflavonifractor sp. An44]|uniref:bifunctional 4-hydroxy-3-methylbut-2-enyl diphosphate reductase/30S ribosomal protein S1 n=1 Tax=Pseudoflavonifractor sp. An44 TaxID=1965635 RepID=UPI000B38C85A|nr:bifunctional 4-hydroxy-3-methylbut-2-enyl diphosphate reductase/30S ribosomal protein S1 [Pseudoflavonifractor sp. An44]OUN97304.1 bifunctional 4-hydroxy-3-methylbut-2-enyl diphosphate reductase/30S ribosomal protein S1 [Pseudoflavonifractor sp. An44]
MKEVLLAKSAGFCYGVRRAVEQAQQLAQTQKIYLLGEITHNAHVIAKLEELGAVTVHSLEEVPQGATVLIRAHGEPDRVYAQLQEKGCQVVDATCPNVTRIHDIVRNAAAQGRVPVIVGDPDHPEIVGIAGCAEHSVVAANWEELEKIFQNRPELVHQPLTFVSQTTAIRANWENSVENAKKVCTNAEYFDTICGATSKRQTEAAQLAGRCDSMIVIGDPKSSNTRRLTQICQESCAHVVQVEQADALSPEDFCSVRTLGITAGASTPEWIIKEVYNKMSDEIMEIEQSFAEMLEESFKTLNTGDKVTGTVVAITPTEVQVELGIKYPGYIPVSELSDDPDVKVEDIAKVGEEIETYVMLVSDRDCMVKLSKKRLDAAKNWETIENAVESKEVLEGIITEENKGGLVANVKGIRVFIPASQSGQPRGADLSGMVKTRVQLRITEVNRARRRVVGSIRAVAAEARAAAAAEIWNNIEVGKHYTGTVKSLTSYGAFVDIGGVDGMVHVSELSWSRIKNPAEVVSVGDEVDVYVIGFDPEKKKISLGMKDRSQEPWTVFTSKYSVGDVANVRIVKLMTFGAFAEIVPGVDGLIHISQIADHRVEKPGDELTEGQMVDAKIIAIDEENKKVSLSIRALLEGNDVEETEETEEA